MILTDAPSNGPVSQSAEQLKDSGVAIFTVGVGSRVSKQELQVMASDPLDQNVITLANASELTGLAEKMHSKVCNSEFYVKILSHDHRIALCKIIRETFEAFKVPK